jgi:hypothetical protein
MTAIIMMLGLMITIAKEKQFIEKEGSKRRN